VAPIARSTPRVETPLRLRKLSANRSRALTCGFARAIDLEDQIVEDQIAVA
jgi:hypothetical protein